MKNVFREGQLVYDWRRNEVFRYNAKRDGMLAARGELRVATEKQEAEFDDADPVPATMAPLHGEGAHGAGPQQPTTEP
jgi:hypothetical protein